jgi:uncharacterized protein YkwD
LARGSGHAIWVRVGTVAAAVAVGASAVAYAKPATAAACVGDAWFCPPANSGSSSGSPGTGGGGGNLGGGSGSGGQRSGSGGQPSGSGSQASAGASLGLTAPEQELLTEVNRERAAHGLDALTVNPTLERLANLKAEDMVRLGYFGHDSPDLGLPIQMEENAGYLAESMGGENIAEASSVLQAFAMFVGSPGHLENILYPTYTVTGIAVVPITGGVLVEELFSGPPLG